MLRQSRKITQTKLALDIGVSKQSVSNWENGNILPSIDVLILLSKYFNVSTDYILGLEDKCYIEVTNLSLEQISHIQQIINDIRNKI